MEIRLSGQHLNSSAQTRGAFHVFGLFFAAILIAFSYGCSGIVSGSSPNGNNNNPPPTTPQLSVTPSSVNFSTVVIGQKNTQTLNLANTGSGTLTVQSIQVTGTGFSGTLPTFPMTINAGSSQNITVAFAPTTAATDTGTVTITSNNPSSPDSVSLSGVGQATAPSLQFNPTSEAFGTTTLSTKNSKTATLKNTGNTSITFSSVTVTGAGFGVTSLSSGMSLTPQQQATFTVWFQPGVAGAVNGSLSVNGNGLSSPVTMSLSGTGQSGTSSHSVALSWGASTSSVTGYYVFRGTATGGPYSQLNSSPNTSLGFTDSTVAAGNKYFYVVTSVDTTGTQSVFSNEVSAQVPTP
jgi:hypothetical protein